MFNYTNRHIGDNIRKIRLLKGMKQDTFANKLGIAQQNVSKMERKKEISDEQLEKVAKVLQASVESIKSFDERVIINNNVFFKDLNQTNNPIAEIISYFKGELDKKDEEINRLRDMLEQNQKQDNATQKDGRTLRNIRRGS